MKKSHFNKILAFFAFSPFLIDIKNNSLFIATAKIPNEIYFDFQAALSMSTWRPSEEIHESRFHIDGGPVRNALQVISEALDIPQQQEQENADEDSNVSYVDNSPPGGATGPATQHLLSETPPPHFHNAAAAGNATKTIVASDADVSNGFVKSGRSLPYVFEASESGV